MRMVPPSVRSALPRLQVVPPRSPRSSARRVHAAAHALKLAVGGCLIRQRIDAQQSSSLSEEFEFDARPEEFARWNRLFELPEETRIAFPVYGIDGVQAFHRMLRRLHINFTNVAHLRYEKQTLSMYRDGAHYHGRACVEDMQVLPKERLALVLRVEATDEEGALATVERLTMLVRRLAEGDRVTVVDQYDQRDQAELMGLRTRAAALPAAQTKVPFSIPAATGARFGLLSGDLNFLHTLPAVSRVFGFDRPFVQGMYTAHRVLSLLYQQQAELLAHFDITFCRPAFSNTALVLRADGGRFEIVDEVEQVIAAGSYTRAKTRSARSKRGRRRIHTTSGASRASRAS